MTCKEVYKKSDIQHINPKISVIVPIYNAETYLIQCLESILVQTLDEIEVILIDDGSTDGSYKICQEFATRDKRVRIYEQKNLGSGTARNRGIQLAKGEYLSFLDSDDFFEIDMLKALYRRAKATDSDVVFGDFWLFDNFTKQDTEISWGARQDLIPKTQTFSAKDCPETIFQLNSPAVWTSLYRKSFILKNNIKYDLTRRGQDILFSRTALVMAEKISFVAKRLVHYRTNLKTSEDFSSNKHPFCDFEVLQHLYEYLAERNIFDTYKKSFLNMMAQILIYSEIARLSYPIRFFAEARFANEVVPKFQLDTLHKNYFFSADVYEKIKDCIYSSVHSCSFRNWYEEKTNKVIPIVLTADKKDFFSTVITIQSIIEHMSDNYFYDVYVLYNDLSEQMKNRLENMIAKNIHITWVCVKELIGRMRFPYSLSSFAKDSCRYLLIPSFLSYEKVLWLGAGLVVKTDISKLYDIDLKDNLIAGVPDILSADSERKKIYWEMEPASYINTGVLLINNKLCQKENLQEVFLNELYHQHHSYNSGEQDIINFVCRDKILLLDYKWNFLLTIFCKEKERYDAYIQNICPEDCYIVNYNGGANPWNSSENQYSDLWWKYAKNTPFYRDVLCQYVQSNIKFEKTEHHISEDVVKQPPKKMDAEEFYQLKTAYIRTAWKYFFSFGQTKKKYKIDLDMIAKKLRG